MDRTSRDIDRTSEMDRTSRDIDRTSEMDRTSRDIDRTSEMDRTSGKWIVHHGNGSHIKRNGSYIVLRQGV